MIFLGDIAHPWVERPHWGEMAMPWQGQPVIANLEGTLSDEADAMAHRRLFNKSSVLDALKQQKVEVLSLANNHTMDWPDKFEGGLGRLRDKGFASVGAGMNSKEAAQPAEIEENGRRVLFLAFGWEIIECEAAGKNKPGVNPLRPEHLLASVKALRAREPEAVIVILPHWNYEMECYPQPAHRQLAFAAIDEGADAVVGHHPHRAGGIEFYKNRPVAYSLGNWWLPQNMFFSGKLRYSEEARLQLALEWSAGEEPLCHWFDYDPDTHSLTHVSSEPARESKKIRELTLFQGMAHGEYQKWFKDNRIKKRFLPIYSDHNTRMVNAAKDRYIRARHQGLRMLETLGVRGLLK